MDKKLSEEQSQPKNKRLGKGLNELLKNQDIRGINDVVLQRDDGVEGSGGVMEVKIDRIRPGTFQQRRNFNIQKINDLADSIKMHGVLQPIIVRPLGLTSNYYEIIAGERRYRACKQAGITSIPVRIIDKGDQDSFILGLIENLQREDINPMEEARGMVALKKSFGLSQDEIASKVSKSRSHVANILRLNDLSDGVIELLDQGLISMGHARALLAIEDDTKQFELADQIIKKQMSVRDIEQIVAKIKSSTDSLKQESNLNHPSFLSYQKEYNHIEEKLAELLKARVNIKSSLKGKGKIIIHYDTVDELNNLLGNINADLIPKDI